MAFRGPGGRFISKKQHQFNVRSAASKKAAATRARGERGKFLPSTRPKFQSRTKVPSEAMRTISGLKSERRVKITLEMADGSLVQMFGKGGIRASELRALIDLNRENGMRGLDALLGTAEVQGYVAPEAEDIEAIHIVWE